LDIAIEDSESMSIDRVPAASQTYPKNKSGLGCGYNPQVS